MDRHWRLFRRFWTRGTNMTSWSTFCRWNSRDMRRSREGCRRGRSRNGDLTPLPSFKHSEGKQRWGIFLHYFVIIFVRFDIQKTLGLLVLASDRNGSGFWNFGGYIVHLGSLFFCLWYRLVKACRQERWWRGWKAHDAFFWKMCLEDDVTDFWDIIWTL